MTDLKDRVAIITGAGSGVGRATAKLFAARGAKVVLAGRDGAKLAEASAGLSDALAVPTDVSVAAQCQALAAKTLERFGRIDILVNSAGINLKARTMRELTPESWDKMIRVNLDGAFYCIHAVLPTMLTQKDGVVVNIVSVAGKRGNPLGGAAYVAAKFGMGGLGTVLGNEEKDSGVRVCNIYPGEIDTPILSERPTPVSEAQRAAMLQPEDVAGAALFAACLPARASVPEIILKPTGQLYF